MASRYGETQEVLMAVAKQWVVLVVVLALGVAGCGGQSEVEGDRYTIYVHGGSLLPRGGADAGIEGTLVTVTAVSSSIRARVSTSPTR